MASLLSSGLVISLYIRGSRGLCTSKQCSCYHEAKIAKYLSTLYKGGLNGLE